ncbi:putative membrane protein [Porphyridium purpureum]|uniref:Putative membrane protein n=1 Tax=Porphyridium purpureum TaxID=35688 RepID=A0A5J4Z6F6_PORPP|nr:putative membrane protein [Porphyridium purpureum]|eukprot:POR9401..scf295_1
MTAAVEEKHDDATDLMTSPRNPFSPGERDDLLNTADRRTIGADGRLEANAANASSPKDPAMEVEVRDPGREGDGGGSGLVYRQSGNSRFHEALVSFENNHVLAQPDSRDLRAKHQPGAWRNDGPQMLLLVTLYFLQGIPMGLCFGSLPFILQGEGHLSYTQLGVFSLASYPYSLKLAWSPIVDSVWNARLGRRKSWIIPAQVMSAVLMLALSFHTQKTIEEGRVLLLTVMFSMLVFLAATQDIAVDGWALTILSKQNLSYASTCQSLGLTSGFFCSFTLFLALSNSEFCQTYLSSFIPIPASGSLLTLEKFLRIAAAMYLVVTGSLIFVKEANGSATNGSSSRERTEMYKTYEDLGALLRMPQLWRLGVALFIAKIGFAVHDNVTALKLLEKGFPRQTMALVALIQLPFEIAGTILVGKWSSGKRPLLPYFYGQCLRILICAAAPFMVMAYSPGTGPGAAVSWPYFVTFVLLSTLYQFASDSLMFVSMGAFFARISDDSIGGTYLTLLNTISNLGGTWPKVFALYFVDYFTARTPCDLDIPEHCPLEMDGYFVCAFAAVPISLVVFGFVSQRLQALESLPSQSWKLPPSSESAKNHFIMILMSRHLFRQGPGTVHRTSSYAERTHHPTCLALRPPALSRSCSIAAQKKSPAPHRCENMHGTWWKPKRSARISIQSVDVRSGAAPTAHRFEAFSLRSRLLTFLGTTTVNDWNDDDVEDQLEGIVLMTSATTRVSSF